MTAEVEHNFCQTTVVALDVARTGGIDRGRHPHVRHGGRPGRHLAGLQHPVGRRLPDGAQPLEPVGAERLDRHHGHGHGADHRVAQHRPVGRLAARVPRLHDGDGPDRLDPQLARPRVRPLVHVDHRTGDRDRPRCRDRCRPGLHRRLRRRAVVHRDARRDPDLARSHLPLRPGPDAGADGRQLPAARRWTARFARRVAQLAAGRDRLRPHRLRHRRRPPAPAPLPVRRPSARSRHRARGDRLPDRPRRGLARQQLSMAGPARQPVRRATRHRRAGGRTEDPDGDRLPGRDPHRRRAWS